MNYVWKRFDDKKEILSVMQELRKKFIEKNTIAGEFIVSQSTYEILRIEYRILSTYYGIPIVVSTKQPDNIITLVDTLKSLAMISGLLYRYDLPEKYIVNDGATILFWKDGTKTIVKKSKNDIFDPVKSFLWAYFLKHSGMSRTKANKYLAKINEEN